MVRDGLIQFVPLFCIPVISSINGSNIEATIHFSSKVVGDVYFFKVIIIIILM